MSSEHDMTVVAGLWHESVRCWRFGSRQARRLESSLPDAVKVIVCPSRDELLEALPQARVALVWSFEQDWFAFAPRLEWIATPAAGMDFFQVEPPAGVSLTYGAFHGPIIAETVLGMMLGFSRGLFEGLRRQSGADPWQPGVLERGMRLLSGSRVTILGFGHIGQAVGRLAHAAGARVTGVRRSRMERLSWFGPDEHVTDMQGFDTALSDTDHLVLALPGGRETDGLVDERRLALLPRRACIYNVGRGNSVDEAALVKALRSGHLRAAGLDVYREEPLPVDHPLRSCRNALLLPHASAIAPEYLDRFVDEFAVRFRERYGAAGQA